MHFYFSINWYSDFYITAYFKASGLFICHIELQKELDIFVKLKEGWYVCFVQVEISRHNLKVYI